jgi:transcriptional regulator with XRE-family HTH domain
MPIEPTWTDDTVLHELGRRLERLRLDRNESQAALAERAGVSRATVVRAEQGAGVTMKAMLRLLRALDLFDGLDALIPEPSVSPIEQLDRERGRRRRASGSRTPAEAPREDDGFQWGTT